MSNTSLEDKVKPKDTDADQSESMKTECVGEASELCHSGVRVKMEADEDDVKSAGHRENRLTSIIDQLRCQSKLKGMS
ncbi:unnamed protein product, partial [Iphiclides podalirius]